MERPGSIRSARWASARLSEVRALERCAAGTREKLETGPMAVERRICISEETVEHAEAAERIEGGRWAEGLFEKITVP